MYFDGGEAHLAYGGDQRWLPGAVACRIDQGSIKAALMRLVELVDHLPGNIRMKNLYLDAQLGRIFTDLLIVLWQGHGTEDLSLDFPTHVHPSTMNDQDLLHNVNLQLKEGACSGYSDSGLTGRSVLRPKKISRASRAPYC